MSKKELKQFLDELDNNELQEQVLDLYQRFKSVKEFYDFSFKPNEDKRFDEAKRRIGREYFPDAGRKEKKRRSVAQKLIKHFLQLEADPTRIADLMFFNIEIAQTYNAEKLIKQEAFYRSMLKSFQEAVEFIQAEFLLEESKLRIEQIVGICNQQDWPNKIAFNKAVSELEKI